MIVVTFKKKANDRIGKVIVEGHSGYAENGEDIVCAGVSVLTISILNGLTDIVGLKDIPKEVDEGFTSFIVPNGVDSKQQIQIDVLMDTYYLGIKQMSIAYNDYIKMIDDNNGGELDD